MEQQQDAPEPRHSRRTTIVAVVIAAIVLLLIIVAVRSHRASAQADTSTAGPGGKGGRGGPIPVAVAAVQQQDVPVYLSGLGNVAAYYTVTVKTRIDGQLQSVNFKEGQRVHKGEELALIDPRPSQTALLQADAKRFQDAAQLENARRDLQRYADLYHQGVVPQQQYNTQQSQVAVDEGLIKADDANIENAKLNVSYCHITSPIDGTVGLRNLDPGNMVHASDPNGLMTITQLQPISVVFTLPEDNLPQVVQATRGGTLAVDAWSRDDTQKIATGRLETVDNQIDPNTGTFRLKAVFDNQDGALYPNQFVNAKLRVKVLPNAVVAPAAAIQHGAQGAYVYAVDANKTVAMRPVGVLLTQGTITVVSGLQAGETVVTDGQDKLQPGAKVSVAGEGGRRRGGPRS